MISKKDINREFDLLLEKLNEIEINTISDAKIKAETLLSKARLAQQIENVRREMLELLKYVTLMRRKIKELNDTTKVSKS